MTYRLSPRGVAAVDDEVRSCGEACGVRGEVEDGGGDLLGLGEAAHGGRGEPHLGPLGLGHAELGQGRPYVAGRDAVDPDAAVGPFAGEALCHGDHSRLRGVVGGLGLGVVGDDARHRGDVDDRTGTALEHRLPDLAATPEHAVEVHGDNGQPLLVGDFFGGDVVDYPGVVDEHVDPSVLVEHRLHEVPHGGGVCYVGVDKGAIEFLGDVGAGLVVDLGDDHLCPRVV